MKQLLIFILLRFALTEACSLDPAYQAQIQKDFLLFQDGITPDMISKIRHVDLLHKCYVQFINGTPLSNCNDPYYQFYHQIYQEFAPKLPDMEFVMTIFDNPTVYKNKCNGMAKDYLRTCQCGEGYGDTFPGHSYFKRIKAFKVFDKIPVFSQAVLPDCTNDILVPSYYHLNHTYRDDIALTPWQSKQFKIFWRGGITDIQDNPTSIRDPADFSHRFNMVRVTRDIPECDIKITHANSLPWTWITKCLKREYPIAKKVDQNSLHKYKVLIDIDGATYSERFPKLLHMGSAVFKAKVFEDIGSVAMTPWQHYVPVNIDMSDFKQKLDWAKNNDRQLKEIAERGYLRSKQVHSYAMYKCYLWHVLKKYESLLRKGGAI